MQEMFKYALNTHITKDGLQDKLNAMELEVDRNYYFKIYLPSIPSIVFVQRRFRQQRLLRRFRELIH